MIARLPEAAAERARRRLRKDAAKRGRTHPRSLEAAGFVLLLTSLPPAEFPPGRVLALYRLRWQVELAFKRLKSLLGLGALPAKSADLARAWLWAKLILRCSRRTRPAPWPPFPPRGGARAASLWRLARAALLSLTAAVLGPLPPRRWRARAAALWRLLAEPPRRRPSQAGEAARCLS